MSTQMQRTIDIQSNLRFDPKALENGDTTQLNNWAKGPGSSIYIQWIPDEMTEKDVTNRFSHFGDIDRIEFVPKFDANRKQIGRMLFVHFNKWSTTTSFSAEIVNIHPEPLVLEYRVINRYGVEKVYGLKCRINMRPINKVEYSNSQLTDMFERLNDRVVKEMEALRKEIEELRKENLALQNK